MYAEVDFSNLTVSYYMAELPVNERERIWEDVQIEEIKIGLSKQSSTIV